MLDDLQLALQSCSTITTEHLNLISFSVMKVCLVAIVLSISASDVLKEYGQPAWQSIKKCWINFSIVRMFVTLKNSLLNINHF